MDWARAIDRNSEALKGIVAALFAMLGLDGAATVAAPASPSMAKSTSTMPLSASLLRSIALAQSMMASYPTERTEQEHEPIGIICQGE